MDNTIMPSTEREVKVQKRSLLGNPVVIALLPVVAVIIDYYLTFSVSRSRSLIMLVDSSPFLKFALEKNLLLQYLAILLIFYYIAAFAVLKLLEGTMYYRIGCGLIVLISTTHVLGGLSWIVRNPVYSNSVMLVSFAGIALAVLAFGHAVYRTYLHPV